MENGQLEGSVAGSEPRASETENGEEPSGSTAGLTAREHECFRSFVEQCRAQGLLNRPTGLSAEDALDGLHDEITLLY